MKLLVGEAGVDIYNLIKYFQDQIIILVLIKSHRWLQVGTMLFVKGDIIADGPSTDMGELALGQNLSSSFYALEWI